MIQKFFNETFGNKSICILGFGREGRSSYKALQKYTHANLIYIADSNPQVEKQFLEEFGFMDNVIFYCGPMYVQALEKAEIIIKSPGISPRTLRTGLKNLRFLSQTEIFLHLFRDKIIGVTGTKGKSTTVSLLYHILKTAGRKVLLAGNIGIPPFELLDEVDDETIIVYEMSSHQLENISISPAMAVLLNIFQEHLDHYDTYKDYQLAKMNIARWQSEEDIFIVNEANETIKEVMAEVDSAGIHYGLGKKSDSTGRGVWCENNDIIIDHDREIYKIGDICSNRKLKGSHNLMNISAATLAAHLKGVDDEAIQNAVATFEGLPHRLEFVRQWNGASFYNDSISTIPEATIEALNTFGNVDTLILGGFDRGIDYSLLTTFLSKHPVPKLIFVGKAGKRICSEYLPQSSAGSAYWMFDNFEEAVRKAAEVCSPGSICLLSPAAASYDMFRNFEERGEVYRRIVQSL